MNKKWVEELRTKLSKKEPEFKITQEELKKRFPRNYRDAYSADQALEDFPFIQNLLSLHSIQVNLYGSLDSDHFSIKLYSLNEAITLSQSMPILESMGLEVLIERNYQLEWDNHIIWIHHFTLNKTPTSIQQDREKLPRYFADLFTSVWYRETENDEFNRLLFSSYLKTKNIAILRAYSAYLKQIKFPYSRALIIRTLTANAELTLLLIKLFLYKFDPEVDKSELFESTKERYFTLLNDIESLDQDLIYKQLFNLIDATVRTNYFQPSQQNNAFISFKIRSDQVNRLPSPKPLFEIFVYSSRFEGIHLRGGKVARGGLRWSDRKEDYRTEILGLMKAQMVKNAVIVPADRKGVLSQSKQKTWSEMKYSKKSKPVINSISMLCWKLQTT